MFGSRIHKICPFLANLNKVFFVLIFVPLSLIGYKVEKYGLLMPNVRPDKPELYLCTSLKVNSTNFYIVGFEPNATMQTVHHILLYGCTKPGSTNLVWDCGHWPSNNSEWDYASHCGNDEEEMWSGREMILYAWGRDAPTFELPPEVGFKFGGRSPIQYLVLQVHYAVVDQFKDGSTDNSGVFLHYTEHPLSKLAGVYYFVTNGEIPPMSEEHLEVFCPIQENKTIHPFAFLTHTHGLGKVVSGYLVTNDSSGQNHWTLIGKKNPQEPQTFYPVANTVTVSKGDMLAVRCTMVSNRSTVTYMGHTNNDEMCNYFIMYYVDGGDILDQKMCYVPGSPVDYWNLHLNNIPHKDASTVD